MLVKNFNRDRGAKLMREMGVSVPGSRSYAHGDGGGHHAVVPNSALVQRPQLLHQHKRVTPGWVGAVDPPYYEDQPLQAATKKTAEPESSVQG